MRPLVKMQATSFSTYAQNIKILWLQLNDFLDKIGPKMRVSDFSSTGSTRFIRKWFKSHRSSLAYLTYYKMTWHKNWEFVIQIFYLRFWPLKVPLAWDLNIWSTVRLRFRKRIFGHNFKTLEKLAIHDFQYQTEVVYSIKW